MKTLSKFRTFSATFADLAFEPLTITAVMAKNVQVVNYDPMHLDSILSRVVVDMAMGNGQGLPNSNEGYWLPLPLKAAWFSEDGLPLWCSSVLMPVGETMDDVTYRHKRTLSGKWSKGPTIRPSQGRWKERRIPVPTMICDRLEARVIGNPEWLERLLCNVKFIGKNRSIGMGEVERFEIESARWTEREIFQSDGKIIRNVPAAACDSMGIPWLHNPTLVAWTPPYWKRSLNAMGWRAGATIDPLLQIDYFDGVT